MVQLWSEHDNIHLVTIVSNPKFRVVDNPKHGEQNKTNVMMSMVHGIILEFKVQNAKNSCDVMIELKPTSVHLHDRTCWSQ